MWKQLALVGALLGVPASSGCVTERESAPPGLDSAVARRFQATRAWTVNERGSRAGSVVRYERSEAPERFFYIVRNRHDQDLGMIDALGRFYRNRPHASEPEWIGSGSILQGVIQILELGKRTELSEVPLESANPTPSQGSPE